MDAYTIQVTIENKPGISDPEGQTILNDLVLVERGVPVTDIRSSKGLRFTISAENSQAAIYEVRRICDELRIYNPLVSRITISAVR